MTYDALLDICIYVLLLVVDVVCIYTHLPHTLLSSIPELLNLGIGGVLVIVMRSLVLT